MLYSEEGGQSYGENINSFHAKKTKDIQHKGTKSLTDKRSVNTIYLGTRNFYHNDKYIVGSQQILTKIR